MPRSVVPILRAPRWSSESASRPRWCGRIRCARSEITRFSPTSIPAARSSPSSRSIATGIDHDTVADHAQDARVQDARGDQVQHELASGHDHGVTRVVPAVVAGHDLHACGEKIDDLPLPLVAPLGADDHDIGHVLRSSSPSSLQSSAGSGSAPISGRAGSVSKV